MLSLLSQTSFITDMTNIKEIFGKKRSKSKTSDTNRSCQNPVVEINPQPAYHNQTNAYQPQQPIYPQHMYPHPHNFMPCAFGYHCQPQQPVIQSPQQSAACPMQTQYRTGTLESRMTDSNIMMSGQLQLPPPSSVTMPTFQNNQIHSAINNHQSPHCTDNLYYNQTSLTNQQQQQQQLQQQQQHHQQQIHHQQVNQIQDQTNQNLLLQQQQLQQQQQQLQQQIHHQSVNQIQDQTNQNILLQQQQQQQHLQQQQQQQPQQTQQQQIPQQQLQVSHHQSLQSDQMLHLSQKLVDEQRQKQQQQQLLDQKYQQQMQQQYQNHTQIAHETAYGDGHLPLEAKCLMHESSYTELMKLGAILKNDIRRLDEELECIRKELPEYRVDEAKI